MTGVRAWMVSAALLLCGPALAQPTISAHQAEDYVGKGEVRVCGWVAAAKHVPSVKGEPTFLDLGRAHPLQDLTLVIWEDVRDDFSTPPESTYFQQHVCATGEVKYYGRGLQLVVATPGAITTGLACVCAAADTIVGNTSQFVGDLPDELKPYCIRDLKKSFEALDPADKTGRAQCKLALRELQAHLPPDPDKHQWSVAVEAGAQGSTFNTDGSVAMTDDDTGLFDDTEPFLGFRGHIGAIGRRVWHLGWTVRFGSVDIAVEDAESIGMAGETILNNAETLYLNLEGYRSFGPHYAAGLRASGYSPTEGSDEVPSEFLGEYAAFGRVTNQHRNLLRGSYLELGYVYSERFLEESRAFATTRVMGKTGKETALFVEFAATAGSGSDDLRVAIGIQHNLLRSADGAADVTP